MNQEEMKKRFGRIDTKVVEYRDGVISGVHGSKKELWPSLLAFVLVVLAIEMIVANRI